MQAGVRDVSLGLTLVMENMVAVLAHKAKPLEEPLPVVRYTEALAVAAVEVAAVPTEAGVAHGVTMATPVAEQLVPVAATPQPVVPVTATLLAAEMEEAVEDVRLTDPRVARAEREVSPVVEEEAVVPLKLALVGLQVRVQGVRLGFGRSR